MQFSEVSLESKPCPLGCNGGDKFLLSGHDLQQCLPGKFSVVKCKLCGLVRTNPRPTPDTMGFYYPDSYSPYNNTVIADSQKLRKALPEWKRIAGKLFDFYTAHIPPVEKGRMLEIGCASGAFLHKMSMQGWEAEGIEFSSKASDNVKSLGYNVYSGSLENAPAPQRLYDLVVGWAVFEHLHEPVYSLNKLCEWTCKDAWLTISVPNLNSLGFHLFRDIWYGLHLPNHLFHYSPKTLDMVLQKGGWKTQRVFYQRVSFDISGSLFYLLREKNILHKLSGKLQVMVNDPGKEIYLGYPLFYLLGLLQMTGMMTVWAKKTDRTDYRR